MKRVFHIACVLLLGALIWAGGTNIAYANAVCTIELPLPADAERVIYSGAQDEALEISGGKSGQTVTLNIPASMGNSVTVRGLQKFGEETFVIQFTDIDAYATTFEYETLKVTFSEPAKAFTVYLGDRTNPILILDVKGNLQPGQEYSVPIPLIAHLGIGSTYLDAKGNVKPGPSISGPQGLPPSEEGWRSFKNGWYFLEKGMVVKTRWGQDKKAWYHLGKNGLMDTGWIQDRGKWYYLDPKSGAMQVGWLYRENAWYHLDQSGAMTTGWLQDENDWYYFDPTSGVMQIRWLHWKNKWYYLDSDGDMQTGWLETPKGTWYYLWPSGIMAANEAVTVDGKTYHFAANGKWIP